MIRRAKRMIGNLVAACVSLLIFASWFVLPAETEASVSYLEGINEPSNGAGRVATHESTHENALECVETSVDMPTEETAEIEPYIAPQEVETEAETETYPNLPEPTEYYQVLPEPDPIVETDIDALIVQVAGEYGLPWELVRAVVWVESTFDPYAVSDHPDYGLMQVWEQVWIDYGYDPKDPIVYDPLTNLRMGCQVLREKIDLSDGDLTKALMRYNKGDGEAMSQWSQGIFSTDYTERVLERYYAYMRGEY